jgi:hypothetical protein
MALKTDENSKSVSIVYPLYENNILAYRPLWE